MQRLPRLVPLGHAGGLNAAGLLRTSVGDSCAGEAHLRHLAVFLQLCVQSGVDTGRCPSRLKSALSSSSSVLHTLAEIHGQDRLQHTETLAGTTTRTLRFLIYPSNTEQK
jgi:hypothetical protein